MVMICNECGKEIWNNFVLYEEEIDGKSLFYHFSCLKRKIIKEYEESLNLEGRKRIKSIFKMFDDV